MKKILLLVGLGFAIKALLKRTGNRNDAPGLRAQNAGSDDGLDGGDFDGDVEGDQFDRDGFDRIGTDGDRESPSARAGADDSATLAMLQQFDAHSIALAECALERSVGDDTRSVATLLLEEHTRNQSQLRTLRAALGADEVDVGAATLAEQRDDAELLDQIQRLDAGTFEAGWIGAARESHARMLERIDDALATDIEDTRLAEHVRLVRDDVRAHLQNLEALSGNSVDVETRAA